MNLAAGGKIEQTIVKDPGTYQWDSNGSRWFNIQILNSANFQRITGLPQPQTPVDVQTYVAHGFPFFEMWEEPSDIAGDFAIVQSVGQIDEVVDPVVIPQSLVQITRRLSRFGIFDTDIHLGNEEAEEEDGANMGLPGFGNGEFDQALLAERLAAVLERESMEEQDDYYELELMADIRNVNRNDSFFYNPGAGVVLPTFRSLAELERIMA
jgi:hypothetical protein